VRISELEVLGWFVVVAGEGREGGSKQASKGGREGEGGREGGSCCNRIQDLNT